MRQRKVPAGMVWGDCPADCCLARGDSALQLWGLATQRGRTKDGCRRKRGTSDTLLRSHTDVLYRHQSSWSDTGELVAIRPDDSPYASITMHTTWHGKRALISATRTSWSRLTRSLGSQKGPFGALSCESGRTWRHSQRQDQWTDGYFTHTASSNHVAYCW